MRVFCNVKTFGLVWSGVGGITSFFYSLLYAAKCTDQVKQNGGPLVFVSLVELIARDYALGLAVSL